MAYRAYVGNIPFTFTKSDLEGLFKSFGVVKSTDIIIDRETGRSRGFGFVEMETSEQLAAAIQGMHGSLVNGRPLTVNEARERERSSGPPRGPGGFSPRPSGDRPFNSDRPPRSFDRPLGERSFGDRSAPGAPRTAGPGAPGGARPAADRGPAGGPGPGAGPAKRERTPERRQPKMDGYEREHKDWRRYNDDDEG